MQRKAIFNTWYIALFIISFLATRGADGEPGIFLLGHIILGLSYFVHNLKSHQKVEKIHAKHLIVFPIISGIPFFIGCKLDGMAGILLCAIPSSAFFIVLTAVIALSIKEYIKSI